MRNWINRRNVFFFLAVVISAALVIYEFGIPAKIYGAQIIPPKLMPDFLLLQSANGPIRLSSFRGKLVVLYFGYTSCPDICPLTLANLRQAMDKIGDKAKDVQVIFISVDWKRDTPQKLASYEGAFRPDFIGITGSQAQIDAVTKDYGIYYLLNVPDNKGFYSVDHTATVMVLNRKGLLALTWPNGTQPDAISSDMLEFLKQ